MKISLIAPTCKRPTLFRGFIDSIEKTVNNRSNIEVLVIVDEDDDQSKAYVTQTMSEFKSLDIRMLTRQRSIHLNEDYYNWASRQAEGELIWIMADDLVLTAYSWDEKVQTEVTSYLHKYPDGVFSVGLVANTPPPSHRLPKFPCFPMFHKNVMKATGGWLLHPKPCNWGVDYINYAIFFPLDRLLLINDRNYLNHISHHNKQVEVDATSERIGQIFNQTKMMPGHNTDIILANEVPTIQNEIKDYCALVARKETA